MPRNKKFDQMNEAAVEFDRQQTIKDGLSEIYQDDAGDIIDVKKLQIKPQRGWRSLVIKIAIGAVLVALAAGGAWYWFRGRIDPTAVELSLSGPGNLVAGQEFDYVLNYKNHNSAALKNVYIKVEWPENFIFLSSQPDAGPNKEWRLDSVAAGAAGQITIRGKIINEVGKSNVALAEMYYAIDKFSSEYKKVATVDLQVASTGLETVVLRDASALVGEAQKIVFKYKLKPDGQLNHFWLTLEPSDISQVEFINDDTPLAGAKLIKPWMWEIDQADDKEKSVPINFKFIDKVKDNYQLTLKLISRETGTSAPALLATGTAATSSLEPNIVSEPKPDNIFYQEVLDYEIVNNDLNLSLVINGSDQDQGINFGQTLNFSLSYANKGAKPIEEVVIMAVVEGDIVDWNSFKDSLKGRLGDKSVTWSKNELPGLASLAPGDKGIIDFSLKVKDFAKIKNLKTFDQEITSYAKFAAKVAADAATPVPDSNKSNTIVNKINSDLTFQTNLVYFNNDNIPLGSGPIPFTAGQTTVVRGSWSVFSSLHDLNNLTVSLKLPDYVAWGEKRQLGGGELVYDQASRTVSWHLNQLTAGQDALTASFDLAVTPGNSQRHQLLVIMPKAQVTATDSVTTSQISKEGVIKTSKLEDDPIIGASDIDNNGGLVK